MTRTSLVCVGSCAIDTILTVPYYLEEDSKLRATAFARRRGGNTPNTLEVLQQLVEGDHIDASTATTCSRDSKPGLYLIVSLPAKDSADATFITESFDLKTTSNSPVKTLVDLSYGIYRNDHKEAVSSYIISSESTASRTIINRNELPEMTYEEFVNSAEALLTTVSGSQEGPSDRFWFHFEGRIPDITLKCIEYLRAHKAFATDGSVQAPPLRLTISVELEKPGREGLQDLANEADFVFYSKAWASGQGCVSAQDCLLKQAKVFVREAVEPKSKTMICTWGDSGACALLLSSGTVHEDEIIHSPAYISEDTPVIDATGAGDTFTAGVLYALIYRDGVAQQGHPSWSLEQTLEFANGLAGRKILQPGFGGLPASSQSLKDDLDRRSRASQHNQVHEQVGRNVRQRS